MEKYNYNPKQKKQKKQNSTQLTKENRTKGEDNCTSSLLLLICGRRSCTVKLGYEDDG